MKLKPIKKFRPFTFLQIFKIERWLREQAELGLRLIDYKFCTFYFLKCRSSTREYFIYKSPLLEKNDIFHLEFRGMKRWYGKRKSELNKLLRDVIEIDNKKIDEKYNKYAIDRNFHYQKYCTKMLIFYSVVFCVLVGISFFKIVFLGFALMSFMSIVYYLISVVILKHQLRSLKK